MKALLRPLFVCGLSIAMAATSLVGSSSVALAATRPSITTWSISAPVYEGDRPFVTATFTDPDAGDWHTVDVSWGDNSYDTYTLAVGDRSFSVQKSVPYVDESATALTVQITVNDPIYSNSRFLTVTVLNAAPSITSFGLSSTDMDAGQAVTATAAFKDGGAADTHTVTMDWGDGSAATTTNLAAGVLSFLSPCVLPLVPAYLAYISGVSAEGERAHVVPNALSSRPSLRTVCSVRKGLPPPWALLFANLFARRPARGVER